MITVHNGGEEDLSAVMYGVPSYNTMQYVDHLIENTQTRLSEHAINFREQFRETFDVVDIEKITRLASAAANMVGSIWTSDNIRTLTTIAQFQTAKFKMQRWVMANPTVRELYHDGQLDGYSKTYKDFEPGLVGNDHYDYRRVTEFNYFPQPGEFNEDGTPYVAAVSWDEDIYDPDNDVLTEAEKMDVYNSWNNINDLLDFGDSDPTSIYNASLN